MAPLRERALVCQKCPHLVKSRTQVVFGAGNADEAIPLLITHEGEITLVFTDVEMPGSMNGFALASHIAATWPEIGVLVASGRIEPDPGALPETAVFVRKPFSAAVVHDRVRELLPEDQRPAPLKGKRG